ncbi:MAG: phytanoyl-CoA dioxygenase family protein, partial [Pseudomonadota bacterium]|nr:phytanoyl-CoA dioxygenase family protein [Pseudomonadota bacterium]
MSFRLTKEQIDRFNDDGYLIVDNLLDEKTITQLHTRFDRLFRGEFETGIRPDEVNWQEGDSDPELTRQICNAWKS